MAAANESQGLKIAVAAFVSLSVILAVTSYFAYSNYAQTYAKYQAAEEKSREDSSTAQQAVANLSELRTRSGYANLEDFEALKAAIKKDDDKLNNDITEIVTKIRQMTGQYAAAGGSDPKIKELQQAADQIFADLREEPNKTFASTISRIRDLLEAQSTLTTAYALDNLNLRASLESTNQVGGAKIGEVESALANTKTDLEGVQVENEKQRRDLLDKVDQLQTDYNTILTEYENFKNRTNLVREENEKRISDFIAQNTFLRNQNEKRGTIMDSPDGLVTAVDYVHNEVRINVGRSKGVQPQMTFAIFDRNAPIPNESPKATIMLTSVGTSDSRGRIQSATLDGRDVQGVGGLMDPIRPGDYIYSPVWDENAPRRYALIGKIDMNRDGRDDRQDLIRLIQQAGGIVEYDLPPTDAGKETGKLTGLCSKYVVDERQALNDENRAGTEVETDTDLAFLKKKTDALREAQSLGIAPIPIERLLDSLGYSPQMVVTGRVEAYDKGTADMLLRSRGRGTPTPDTPPVAPGGNDFRLP